MSSPLLSPEAAASYGNLRRILSRMDKAAIACSGGIDSTLLLRAAADTPGLEVTAFTVNSIFVPHEEVAEAAGQSALLGIKHIVIDLDIKKIPEIRKNPPLRCYHCKKEVFSAIKSEAESMGIFTILEGSHHDDTADYRPGLKALTELGIASPLKEAGFTKKEIREVSRHLGIESWEKPSSPCLATRIPYDTEITDDLIKMIHESEKFIKSLGFRQVRVRTHGNLARIELEQEDMKKFIDPSVRSAVESELKDRGFAYITLDMTGYRTGSMNIGIKREEN
jgi:uncharacterized protein